MISLGDETTLIGLKCGAKFDDSFRGNVNFSDLKFSIFLRLFQIGHFPRYPVIIYYTGQ